MTHSNAKAEPYRSVNCSEANERDPRVFPFGLLTSDGQVQMFGWYRDAMDALRSYVEQDLLGYLIDGDVTKEREAVSRILAEALASGLGITEVVQPLNAATDGTSEILWAGAFEALCHGTDPDAPAMLEEFRDDASIHEQSGPDDASLLTPIQPSELDAFVGFLQRYGY